MNKKNHLIISFKSISIGRQLINLRFRIKFSYLLVISINQSLVFLVVEKKRK